jgi:hypothetical protein
MATEGSQVLLSKKSPVTAVEPDKAGHVADVELWVEPLS